MISLLVAEKGGHPKLVAHACVRIRSIASYFHRGRTDPDARVCDELRMTEILKVSLFHRRTLSNQWLPQVPQAERDHQDEVARQ